uniref:Uncharacterized protein n=1 Tax=Lactuca sativa TaxID=4236 RepID=A0A9R1X7J1_LACSA|nr:hypothetical protein LSAT_V11C600317510 [Lactuca sativa]
MKSSTHHTLLITLTSSSPPPPPLPDKLSDTDGSSGFIHFLQALNDNCKPHLQKHLIQITDAQKASSQKESIVIIHDNLMFCVGSIVGDLGLPSIIVRSSSAASVPAYRIIPRLHKEGRFPIKGNSFGTPSTQIQRYTIYWPHNTIKPEIDNIIHHRYQVPVFTIDPLHKTSPTPSDSFLEEDTNCIALLDKQSPKSVIYASVGSLATMDAKVATEIAWGLANSNQPFIWVVRSGSDLVSEMKVKGLIVKWARQKDVLAHSAVGEFWSHVWLELVRFQFYWNGITNSNSIGITEVDA